MATVGTAPSAHPAAWAESSPSTATTTTHDDTVPRVSRIQKLRGKSISSRPFDIFRELGNGNQHHYQLESSPPLRGKSRSLASLSHGPPPSSNLPPLPTSVLSPKPINIPVPPNLEALETFKPVNHSDDSKRLLTEERPRSTSHLNRIVAQRPASSHIVSPTSKLATCDTCDTPAAQSQTQPPQQQQVEEEHQQREHKVQKEAEDAARIKQEVARLEAETDRILAEQKQLDLVRLQAQLATPPPKSKRPILDRLSLFARGRKSNGQSQPGTPSTIATTIFSVDFSRSSSLEDPLSPDIMAMIGQGGKGIIPQIDAPVSAINGGERRVTIRCLSSTINLPVTSDTSAVDILQGTADMTRHHISTATSVVVECYTQLGLERRLRRYERIRDVINSWDRDEQNSLLILSCDASQSDGDLDMGSVPRSEDPPVGFTVQIHHSSRPGKWNKRYVTLLDNGQMIASKRPNYSEKDSTALCHLSDFDIYTPKESEMRRHLKPPKKFCYAIKSQQKTVVFPDGENFVHFFSTENEKLAERFFELVHGWRSWYLVNKQVDLRKKDKAPRISYAPLDGVGLSGNSGNNADRGQPKPLMDVAGFEMPPDDPKSSPQAPRTSQKEPGSEREFSPGGLLGDVYDKLRLAESAKTTAVVTAVDGPFTDGPNLLNGGGKSSPLAETNPEKADGGSWFPSASEHSARVRSQTMQSMRRPKTAEPVTARRDKSGAALNNFPDPPPRRRDGQGPSGGGHGVRPRTGGPLINFATGGHQQNPMLDGSPRPMQRRGAPPLPPPPSGSLPPGPHVSRTRSRSTAGPHTGGSRRFPAKDCPAVPPMPSGSTKRDGPSDEPLVNRAR